MADACSSSARFVSAARLSAATAHASAAAHAAASTVIRTTVTDTLLAV
jgi:hypothetical protein